MFRFRAAAFGVAAFIAATVAVSVLLPRPAADVAVRVAAALACAVGIGVASWAGWRSRGDERRWRLLVAGALACAQLPLLGLVKAAAKGRAFPAIARYDGLYLLGYGLVLAAVLAFPAAPPGGSDGPVSGVGRLQHAVVVLDTLLVVGSLVLLDQMAVLRNALADPARLASFAAGDAAKLAVVTTALLVPTFRPPRSPVSFALLAGGIVAHALGASPFLYIVGRRWLNVAPPLVTGLVAAPELMALACLAPPPAQGGPPGQPSQLGLWYSALSYLPLGAVAVVALTLLPTHWALDNLDLYGLLALLLVALARQVSLLVENNRLLGLVRHQALHDPLTGLANRTLFLDRLGYALTRHDRDRRVLALLFCDLDDFKGVNDNLGHAAGDALLRTAAARLAGAVRSADTVARLGGDEFAVLFEGVGDDPQAIARRVVEAVRGPRTPAGAWQDPIHLSAGLVVAGPGDGPVTADGLLYSADLAMYAAKHRGKGGLVIYRQEIHGPVPRPPRPVPPDDRQHHPG